MQLSVYVADPALLKLSRSYMYMYVLSMSLLLLPKLARNTVLSKFVMFDGMAGLSSPTATVFVVSAVSLVISMVQTRSNMKKLHSMVHSTCTVTVIRNGIGTHVDSVRM